LKHKIVGLEQQISTVSKHCRDLACIESSSRRESETVIPTEDGHELNSIKEQTEVSSLKRSDAVETKFIYKTSESHYRKSDDSVQKAFDDSNGKNVTTEKMADEAYAKEQKVKKKKSKSKQRLRAVEGSQPNLRKHQSQSAYENVVAYSTSSYHSLVNPRTNHGVKNSYPERHSNKKYQHREYGEEYPNHDHTRKPKDARRNFEKAANDNYRSKSRSKSKKRDLDEEFIAEIIKRQYRPITMFGKRVSDISQFSAPVCRDQEYPVRENILEGSELCSCCFDRRKKSRYEYEHDLSDMHSICDTRLYSSKRQTRNSHRRCCDLYSRHHNFHNNSQLYDLIPVKEKASPKFRRKMPVDEMIPYNYYKEVPPSPRTQRPKLNLKAQYYNEFEEYLEYKKSLGRSRSPKKYNRQAKPVEQFEGMESSYKSLYHERTPNQKPQPYKKLQNDSQVQHDADTKSSLLSPLYNVDQGNTTNESTLNKTQESDISADKTDKALSEIKNILQSFLQEIKKETAASQCDNSDMSTKNGEKCLNDFRQDSTKLNASMMPNGGLSVNTFGVPQCGMPSQYLPFTNPCCYPVFPICPVNCMQSGNGYGLPSPSFTCASCVNTAKEKDEAYSKSVNASKESANDKPSNETDQLIKEIYKFVAQKPSSDIKKGHRGKIDDASPRSTNDKKILTSRSIGESSRLSKHDAKVGTQKIKCYSKSCEAIGTRVTSDTYYTRTNPTYSDTVLERLSLEATGTTSDSEVSTESATVKKVSTLVFKLHELAYRM
jgi:hypothetical protein